MAERTTHAVGRLTPIDYFLGIFRPVRKIQRLSLDRNGSLAAVLILSDHLQLHQEQRAQQSRQPDRSGCFIPTLPVQAGSGSHQIYSPFPCSSVNGSFFIRRHSTESFCSRSVGVAPS